MKASVFIVVPSGHTTRWSEKLVLERGVDRRMMAHIFLQPLQGGTDGVALLHITAKIC